MLTPYVLLIPGGLGLLGLYINENNVSLINQTLETLTEYCQGPCHENQNCIATHESNGLDIITALILNDINPLGKNRMDLVSLSFYSFLAVAKISKGG